MKKKSLFDIAMDEKNRKQMEDENVVVTKKNSKISAAIEIIGKILKVVFYIVICILLTVGTTVLANRELREQLMNIVNLNL